MAAKQISTKKIAYTAVFTAAVFVVTTIIRIPMPATMGYVNIGDAVIFMAGALCGPWVGMFAGGVGSALSDCIGALIWAPYTLLIKALEGLVCGLVCRFLVKSRFSLWLNELFLCGGMLLSAVWMGVAYFFAGALIGGYGAALESVPGNTAQGLISVAVAAMAVNVRPLLRAARSHGVEKLFRMEYAYLRKAASENEPDLPKGGESKS